MYSSTYSSELSWLTFCILFSLSYIIYLFFFKRLIPGSSQALRIHYLESLKIQQSTDFINLLYINPNSTKSLLKSLKRPLSNPIKLGHSSSYFLTTFDHSYLFKTTSKSEIKFALNILLDRLEYWLKTNRDSFLPTIHSIFIFDNIGFIVLQNVAFGAIDLLFDFKGSYLGRLNTGSDVAFKELDWFRFKRSGSIQKINIGNLKQVFQQVLKADVNFLMELGIIDYSLLIGIQNKADFHSNSVVFPVEISSISRRLTRAFSVHESSNELMDVESTRVSVFKRFHGGVKGVNGDIYFVGIIDILQEFDLRKWIERGYKRGQFLPLPMARIKPTRSSIFDLFPEIIAPESEKTAQEPSIEEPKRYGMRLVKFVDSHVLTE